MKRKAATSVAPIAKRLRRLERAQRASRPEMKVATFTVNGPVSAASGTPLVKGFAGVDCTAITQGDAANQRSGTRIKLWRIEIRGIQPVRLDGYMLQKHVPDDPTQLDFVNAAYGSYLIEASNNIKYTEWAHFSSLYVPSADDSRFKIVRNFKGMEIKYSGSASAPVENGVYVAWLNSIGIPLTVVASIRVWFTDP